MPPGELHECMRAIDVPISESWLKAAGFKWHQFGGQPGKHWLLWLGDAVRSGGCTCYEDLGIEVTDGAYCGQDTPDGWFCHIRTLVTVRDLVVVIFGLTGIEFDPSLCRSGSMMTPDQVAARDRTDRRLDRVLMREGAAWSSTEKDETRGGALPEHMEAAIKAGVAR
jgi:hypothetical protein